MKQTMRPEFLNRIDELIMFSPLSAIEIKGIVKLQLDLVIQRLKQKGITINIPDKTVAFIAEKGFDFQFGARLIKRIIQKEILNRLSKEIIGDQINSEKEVLIDCPDNKLEFSNQDFSQQPAEITATNTI